MYECVFVKLPVVVGHPECTLWMRRARQRWGDATEAFHGCMPCARVRCVPRRQFSRQLAFHDFAEGKVVTRRGSFLRSSNLFFCIREIDFSFIFFYSFLIVGVSEEDLDDRFIKINFTFA